jgi:hypothetical protein
MSRVDERIKQDLAGLTRPVRTDGVLERLVARKARRRTVRRLQNVTLVVLVLAGTVLGTIVLTRVFAHPDGQAPGTSPTVSSPGPSPSGAGEQFGALCDESQIRADVDGDGALDEVDVWSPSTGNSCTPLPPDVGRRYVLHVSGGKLAEPATPGAAVYPGVRFYGITQDLPECEQPFACRLFAAPDLDGDGAAELAVEIAEDGSTRSLGFYRAEVDPAADRYALVRIAVASPGDAWNDRFGLPPGPAVFGWGGPVTHMQTLACTGSPPMIVAGTAILTDPGRELYDVHYTRLRLMGTDLEVVGTEDYHDVGWGVLLPLVTENLCGAPISGRR